MTRCNACDEIHASTPHATVTGEECRGPVYVNLLRVLESAIAADDASNRLASTHFDIVSASHIEFLQDMGEKALRVARTHFDIAPVPGMPPGAAIVVGADGPELVIVNVGEIDPTTVTVANGTAPAPILDPERTDGALPPIAPLAPVDE